MGFMLSGLPMVGGPFLHQTRNNMNKCIAFVDDDKQVCRYFREYAILTPLREKGKGKLDPLKRRTRPGFLRNQFKDRARAREETPPSLHVLVRRDRRAAFLLGLGWSGAGIRQGAACQKRGGAR